MQKRTRTILFTICLFLFFLITPVVILYSQGYRIDWDSKKIIKTGGLYFKVWPEGAQIFIDGKFKKKTGLLSNSIYIGHLTPREYKVEIKKPGFQTWQKNLEIKENLVTESVNIILFPENPSYENLKQEVKDFFVSPDQKQIILKQPTDNGWDLKIIELDTNLMVNLFSGFQSAEIVLLDLKFAPDSSRILLTTEEKKVKRYWILELQSPIQGQTPDNLIGLDFLGNEVGEISFNPGGSQKIFFLKEDSLFGANITTKKVDSPPLLNNIIIYEISEGNLFWLSSDGFLFKSNLMGGNVEKLNFDSFPVKKDKKYKIYAKSPLFLLKEDRFLYILKPNSLTFEKFSDSINNISFSPDEKKMLYFNDYEIGVLFLEKMDGQPPREALEKLFLTRFSGKIDRVYWLNSSYLIFNSGSKIRISEIDDRDGLNIYDFGEFISPEISFDQFDKRLYILSQGNFSSSVKLLP